MKSKQRKSRSGQSGAAMVELVVLMLVFVPLILLPMYFQDAMRFKFDAQEVVSTSAWDFAYGDYESSSAAALAGSVHSMNQRIFDNGWCGNEDDKKEPAGPWANFRWADASQPATCTAIKGFQKPRGIAGVLGPLPAAFHDKWTKGGLVECTGSIEVENHYIPSIFMQDFSALSDDKMFLDKGQFLPYREYRFGVMVDPWCIHDPADIVQDGSGNKPFKDRVEYVWKEGPSVITFEIFEIAIDAWFAMLTAKEIFNPVMLAAEYPPRPADISSIHPPSKEQSVSAKWGRSSFYVTPFLDGSDDTYKKTFEKRDVWYLGCKQLEPNCT